VSTYPQWHFVENVPENYERYLVPSIFAPWAHDLIEAAALRPGERVLDIACGTGIVARTAARTLGRGGRVVGLDLSAPMLVAARSAAVAEGVSAEWREGSAVKLPLLRVGTSRNHQTGATDGSHRSQRSAVEAKRFCSAPGGALGVKRHRAAPAQSGTQTP
jgi:SAM-dependent methyltransferase